MLLCRGLYSLITSCAAAISLDICLVMVSRVMVSRVIVDVRLVARCVDDPLDVVGAPPLTCREL